MVKEKATPPAKCYAFIILAMLVFGKFIINSNWKQNCLAIGDYIIKKNVEMREESPAFLKAEPVPKS